MQYGLDSAVIGSLQAMPGFLVVFGYPDPKAAGGYSIDVSAHLRRTHDKKNPDNIAAKLIR